MVRTRIAPSPTGVAHIGTAYAALFNLAFARKNEGKFVLRIDDTDIERNLPEAEKVILDGLSWLGLKHDEGPDVGGKFGPYRQSERLAIYRRRTAQLKAKGFAYEKQGAVWLMTPKKRKTGWKDLVRGEIVWDNSELGDFVILKSDGFPVYNFATVVDDIAMKISHVIRAEEHISNTPRQLLIYEALGVKPPKFAHFPLLRNKDRSKISKRKNPVAIQWYKKEGFLPEALINFLCLLGWSHPQEKEFFSLDEFVKKFDLERIKTSQPIFDLEKLKWMNGKYLRKVKSEKLKVKNLRLYLAEYNPELLKKLELFGGDRATKIVDLVKERMETLGRFPELTEFIFERPRLSTKNRSDLGGEIGKKKMLEIIQNEIKGIEGDKGVVGERGFTAQAHEARGRAIAEKLGVKAGGVFMVLRMAITGKLATPPLFEVMEVLGKKESVARLQKMVESLN